MTSGRGIQGTGAAVSRFAALRARLDAARGQSGLPAPAPLPPPSLERSVAIATARAAERVSGLVITPEAVEPKALTLGELPEMLPERALIAVVEAPGERLGIVALCPATLASLIEVQAIGRVTSRPVEVRRATRADASIAAEFVNRLLEDYTGSVAALPDQAAFAGFRYASYLDDPRPLALMLEDGSYRAIRLRLRLGAGGERRGTMLVVVPAFAEAPARSAAPAGAAPAPEAARRGGGALAEAVQSAPIEVCGILCRRSISLREIRALVPGQVIMLPRDSVGECRLETSQGQLLARARLGEHEGRHALRLHGTAASGKGDAEAMRPPAPVPAKEPPAGAAPAPLAADFATPDFSFAAAPVDLGQPDEFRVEDEPAMLVPGQIVIS